VAAHFWLWVYPKNSSLLASRFKICERYSRGEHIKKLVKRIAALKAKKIVWDPILDNPDMEIFAISLDGTDFRMNEQKHSLLPRDPQACSQKFNHGAVKYEIALSLHRAKCVHVAGPFKGGTHGMEVFRGGGLMEKIQEGKLMLADRGYHSKFLHESVKSSLPNSYGSKELENFKSPGRLRHETFSGRLKFFNCLREKFRHGGMDEHKHVFEAVVVIVQYQMDNGSPIFTI
jgi:hypothetical protein